MAIVCPECGVPTRGALINGECPFFLVSCEECEARYEIRIEVEEFE